MVIISGYILGFSVIATFSVLIWIVFYPKAMWEVMTFQNNSNNRFVDCMASLGVIVYFLGFIYLLMFFLVKIYKCLN